MPERAHKDANDDRLGLPNRHGAIDRPTRPDVEKDS